MPTAKKTTTATKKKSSAKAAKKKAPALDWSSTIKKAAEEKRAHATWPGTGDTWKKKVR